MFVCVKVREELVDTNGNHTRKLMTGHILQSLYSTNTEGITVKSLDEMFSARE